MNNDKIILDEMTWSYSRLTTYLNCPKAFHLQYIRKMKTENNAFGEYGSFIHKLLEDYLKGDIGIFDIYEMYKDGYEANVQHDFPPNRYVDLSQKYYDAGLKYFDTFQGIRGEILGVEEKYSFNVGKYKFTGLIDLELVQDGEYIIIDHKSKSAQHKKFNKSGEYIQCIDERYIPKDMIKQLYLYSIPFKEKHGRYPTMLAFNMFKIQDWYKIKFDEEEFEKTYRWAVDSIDKIYATDLYKNGMQGQNFFCDEICSVGYCCNNSNKYLGI